MGRANDAEDRGRRVEADGGYDDVRDTVFGVKDGDGGFEGGEVGDFGRGEESAGWRLALGKYGWGWTIARETREEASRWCILSLELVWED